MKKLTCSFPAKVAAVLLLTASALGTAFFGFCAFASYYYNFYEAGGPFGAALSTLEIDGLISAYDARFIRHNIGVFQCVFKMRDIAIPLAFLLLVLSVLLLVFLLCAAGRRSDVEGVCIGPMDRIPFDVLLAAAGLACFLLLAFVLDNTGYQNSGDLFVRLLLWGVSGSVVFLLALWVLYTFAARVKAGKWWRCTLIYMALHLAWRVLRWTWGLLVRAVKAVGRFSARLFRAIRTEWRVALGFAGYLLGDFFGVLIFLVGMDDGFGEFFGFALLCAVNLAALTVLVLGAHQFAVLKKAGEKLAAGELETKVDTAKMYFDYRRHGENLNSIGDGMSAAVDQRMRSERLKTELITNVSHDIKTPLTSIVNYVDLLQKPHTEEEEQQYLDVLARQSDKLRRLTLDLVEASKASTGNLPTELVPINTEELINQAAAEYAERFERGRLEPVVTMPDKPVTVLADGRHLWRVLDNLLGNAVKYAQPGTRVYIDVRRMDGGALISVKNISRDRLNVSSDELMERFVRGDQSRHTEGSGLGLSIARSLTELMGGTFDVTIDGDLFKAEIRLELPK